MNKIKNFFEDIFLCIKNYFTSSKYIIKGKCNMCGDCCRNILLSDEKGYIKDEETFFAMQKKIRSYKSFKISGKVENEKGNAQGALTFECKYLKNNKCSIYLIRPPFCRSYPKINNKFINNGGVMLDNCGFYFGVNKEFREYFK